MNAKQIEGKNNSYGVLNLNLIAVEKLERPSLWARFKKSFSTPDMNLQTWERLEMKRSRASFHSQEWRQL